MQFWDVAIAISTTLAFSLYLSARRGVNSALAPLVALGFVSVCLMLGGIAYILPFTVWALTALAAVLLVYTLARGPLKAVKTLATPGFVLFAMATLLCFVLFAVRQPVHSEWDEFSSWGTVVKLLGQDNALYTTADYGWFWTHTERPALPLLAYFTQFFGEYAAWKTYVAVDMLLFAGLAAALSALPGRRWRLWVPAGLLALALPFAMNVRGRIVEMDKTYLLAYADLPSGILLGGTLCAYFALRQARRGIWPALLPLAMAALMKENLVPLALVAAVMMAADTLFLRRKAVRLSQRVLESVGAMATPVAMYIIWALHADWANKLNPVTQGGQTGVNMVGATVSAIRQLLGLEPKTGRFALALTELGRAFFDGKNHPVTLFGSAFATTLCVLALFGAALLLAKKGGRAHILLAAGLSLAGMLAYQFELLVSYGFIFNIEGLLDLARYQGSWFSCWLLLGLYFVCESAAHAAQAGLLRAKLAKAGLLAAASGVSLGLMVSMPAQLSVLGYSDAEYSALRLEQERAEAFAEVLQPGDRVFFVCQGGDGGEWFRHAYYMLPAVLDYSITGGYAVNRANITFESLQVYLAENGIDYILLYALDDAFIQTYRGLFSDGLAAYTGLPVLYRQTGEGVYSPYYGGAV